VRRIEEAAAVLRQIYTAPDKAIPADSWRKAASVAVIPGLKKAAFIWWRIRQRADEPPRSNRGCLVRVDLPAHRQRQLPQRETLCWRHLSDGVLQSDADDNKDLYGTAVSARDVLLEATTAPPPVTQPLLSGLKQ
jgi:hypothetical protein